MGKVLGPEGGGGSGTPSSGGPAFAPSKRNLYEAVKAIFHPATNAGVTADDTAAELDVAAAGGVSLAKATNADVDAETDDTKYVTVLKVFRAIARKAKNASATVRGIVLLARNEDVDATETDTGRVPDVAHAKRLIERLAPAPGVVIAASNRAIPATARGNTYVHTGSSNITYTLPAASGGGAVPNGWEVVVSNQGAGDLTIDGHGADTIDGAATLVIAENGRAVRLQKLANGVWATIADTKDETGAGGGLNQAAVDARIAALVNDDRILDLAKENRVAGDRGHFLGVSTTDENQLVIRPAGGAATDQTARDAAAAAQTDADSKLARADLPPFATILAVPNGISGSMFPSPFELFFSERLTDKTISRLVVTVGGQVAGIDPLTPLSTIARTAVDSGALRFALAASALNNVRSNIGVNTLSVDFQIRFTFDDGTSYLHTIPFPVNNVVFEPRELAARRLPTAYLALVDAANIAWNADLGLLASVTLVGNRTLANPTNVRRGDVLVLQVTQDGTGSRTLAFGSNFEWAGGSAPTLSTGANDRDVLTFLALDPNRLLGTISKDVS